MKEIEACFCTILGEIYLPYLDCSLLLTTCLGFITDHIYFLGQVSSQVLGGGAHYFTAQINSMQCLFGYSARGQYYLVF